MMRKLLVALAWGLSVNVYADTSPTIADYTQGLTASMPSTMLSKSYLPIVFTTITGAATATNNKNVTDQASSGGGGTSFDLIIQNGANTQLFAYLASAPLGSVSGVTYCTISANGIADYGSCAGVSLPSSSTIYVYLSSSSSSYIPPTYYSSCSLLNPSISPVGSAPGNIGYGIPNDGNTHYLTITNANTCTLQ